MLLYRRNKGQPIAAPVLLAWSDPATWGGSVPSGGAVTIPSNTSVLLDTSTASLTSLDIQGTLVASPSVDVAITAGYINVGANGTLQIGSEASPYTRNAVITLTGAESTPANRFVPVVDSQPTGTGSISVLAVGTGGVVSGETITLTFTSSTAFTVLSSSAGALAGGTVGTYYNSRVQFKVLAGATAWQAGHVVQIGAGTQMAFTNDGIGRSLQVQPGGTLILQGIVKDGVAALNANASSAATALTLAATPSGWASGDSVVVGTTDFYRVASPHATTLAANVTGASCTLASGLNAARWGALQYPTDAGLSLTPGTFSTYKAGPNVPTVLDSRARIANLTRNIVIQGANDSAWSTSGTGGHVMVMGLASTAQVRGVEFRRMGQAGRIGRYPFHWHMLSYGGQQGGNLNLPSDGTFLGQATAGKHYVKDSAFHDCSQRGTVVHGTWGVEVSNNVYYNITGHCIFLEDSAEQNNTITFNTIIDVRAPTLTNRLVVSDKTTSGAPQQTSATPFQDFASAGIWLGHPNNTLEDNYVNYGPVGIWNAFPVKAFGLCTEVADTPYKTPLLSHKRNTGIGCALMGLCTRFPHETSRGDMGATSITYAPLVSSADTTIDIIGAVLIKNTAGGYQNNVRLANYQQWTIADNQGPGLQGIAAVSPPVASHISDSLFIGRSLNNATAPDEGSVYGPIAGMVSYHFGLTPRRVSVYGYPNKTSSVQAGNIMSSSGGGFIRANDLYLEPYESATTDGGSIKLYTDSGMGWFTPSLNADEISETGGAGRNTPYTALAGAIADPNGWWTTAGYNLVRNNAFHTTGLSSTVAVSAGLGSVVGTPDAVYGIGTNINSYVGTSTNFYDPANLVTERMVVDRMDSSASSVIATHDIPAVGSGTQFANMRHHVAVKGGIYRHTWSGRSLNNRVQVFVNNAFRVTDHFVVAFQIAGTSALVAVGTAYTAFGLTADSAGMTPGWIVQSTGVGSLSALLSATTLSHWLDTTNHLIYVHWWGQGDTPTNVEGDSDGRIVKRSLCISTT